LTNQRRKTGGRERRKDDERVVTLSKVLNREWDVDSWRDYAQVRVPLMIKAVRRLPV
jgi:hypothetical protein